MASKILVSGTPHIRGGESIESIMKHVIFALIPASLGSVYFFGIRSIYVIILSICSCVFFEYIFQKITKQKITISDYSAAVTGLLLALNLPASVPFWLPIVGGFFAIVVAKQIYGGLGQNFMNPALAARAFLLVSFSGKMASWMVPSNGFFNFTYQTMTGPTPLGMVKEGFNPAPADYLNAFIGNIGGSMGETSALLLILGGAYLIYKQIISWKIPVTYIVTVFILSYLFGRDGLYEILIGGLMVGAIFMATDYTSSPVTPNGQIIMGIGCGVLTALLRRFANYPESVSFSILIMNLCVPIIDKYTRPVVFGTTKKGV
ncbi:MAG: RnfABCDGE type electron transport complex subunit D [Clostridiales bacterium]|jgi:electron transport complex protein RnfD|nr:RnfABCDGE type electron transport complex subunit D [Clostridiales bacterium]